MTNRAHATAMPAWAPVDSFRGIRVWTERDASGDRLMAGMLDMIGDDGRQRREFGEAVTGRGAQYTVQVRARKELGAASRGREGVGAGQEVPIRERTFKFPGGPFGVQLRYEYQGISQVQPVFQLGGVAGGAGPNAGPNAGPSGGPSGVPAVGVPAKPFRPARVGGWHYFGRPNDQRPPQRHAPTQLPTQSAPEPPPPWIRPASSSVRCGLLLLGEFRINAADGNAHTEYTEQVLDS